MNVGMQKSQDERFGEWQGKKNTSRAHRAKRWEDERHPGATVICRKSFEKQRAPFSQALYEILNSSNGLQTSRQEKCIAGDQLSWLDREVDASDAKKKKKKKSSCPFRRYFPARSPLLHMSSHKPDGNLCLISKLKTGALIASSKPKQPLFQIFQTLAIALNYACCCLELLEL